MKKEQLKALRTILIDRINAVDENYFEDKESALKALALGIQTFILIEDKLKTLESP